MIKLLCEDNNLEYTGGGYLQCGRHVNCPKKQNNKILGFDCLEYVDNLPENFKIKSSANIDVVNNNRHTVGIMVDN